AVVALQYFRSVNPVELPVGAVVGISMPVLTFTVAVSGLTAVLFGLAPAWKASRVSLIDALKRGGRGFAGRTGGNRTAEVLVAFEMALSVVLLVGAGLLIESVVRMGAAPLGFQPDHLFTASISLPSQRYPNNEHRVRFYDSLSSRFASLPGVV